MTNKTQSSDETLKLKPLTSISLDKGCQPDECAETFNVFVLENQSDYMCYIHKIREFSAEKQFNNNYRDPPITD